MVVRVLQRKEPAGCTEVCMHVRMHICIKRFTMRNRLTWLWKLGSNKVCSWQAEDPGEPMVWTPVQKLAGLRPKKRQRFNSIWRRKSHTPQLKRQAGGTPPWSWGGQPFCSFQAFSWLDEGHHTRVIRFKKSYEIQILISSQNTPTNTPSTMCDQISGHRVVQSGHEIHHHISSQIKFRYTCLDTFIDSCKENPRLHLKIRGKIN